MREDIDMHFPKYQSEKYGLCYLSEAYRGFRGWMYGLVLYSQDSKYAIEVSDSFSYVVEKQSEWEFDKCYVEMGWKQFNEIFRKL